MTKAYKRQIEEYLSKKDFSKEAVFTIMLKNEQTMVEYFDEDDQIDSGNKCGEALDCCYLEFSPSEYEDYKDTTPDYQILSNGNYLCFVSGN